MTYESWRISYQSGEQAALAAFKEVELLRIDRALARQRIDALQAAYRAQVSDYLIGFHTDVATDPAVNGGYKLVPTEQTPIVPEGVRKVTLGFRWDSAAQHHVPTLEIEFEPVPADFPNDAKGWQDRDRFAAMIKAETPEIKK
jgi:hypothetical protein